MATNEETNAAGTDTRPPMLVENDYESWKIRIHRYIRGKPNGKLIWKSIQNGPTPHPMVTDPPPTDSTIMPAPRKKLDSEFNEEENKLEMADTQAEIILSQGLPRHIFNNLNQTSTAKEIFDTCGLLCKIRLASRFDTAITIGWYGVIRSFSRVGPTLISSESSTFIILQLQSYWSSLDTTYRSCFLHGICKFVTDVKLAKSLYTTNNDLLYAYLSKPKQHANEVRLMRERYPDPLALQGKDLIKCINKAMTFLFVVASRFPPSNNQLITSSNPINQATIQDGRVTASSNGGFSKKDKILSYAGTTFHTEDLDAYDSDYDDLSSDKAVLMANLSSCDSDILYEVPYSDTYLNDILNQDVQEMTYYKQTHIADVQDNEINSDSNIDEVTWMTFGGNTRDLGSFGEETDKITTLHQEP
ncbi:hypothetical protein Tco_1438270 [Tanacetum coccineum]